MKKVLVITYYFPPSGGPGVQRVLKFVKYLPQFGWEPVVLTVSNGDFPARDESLLAEISPRVHVYRTTILEPYRLYRRLTGKAADAPTDVENIPKGAGHRSMAERLAAFIRATFFIPDARVGWLLTAVPAARRIIRDEKIDAIYSSSPPYTTALIAGLASWWTRTPWIAGFRDPWVGFISSPERWWLPRAIDRALERSVYRKADRLEAAWEGILTDFRQKYPAISSDHCVHLPNGFDAEDYPAIAKRKNERFTVVYTGSMYGRRNPETFLTAVEELVAEGKVPLSKIRLKFLGRFGGEVQAMFAKTAVRDAVEVIGYRPHSESIREILQADALLLVVDESKESGGIVPGKVFEYIGARRPIIALAPEGAIAGIIRETGSGFVAANHDLPAIKRAFVDCFEKSLYHDDALQPHEEAVRKYERKDITRRLAGLLDDLRRPQDHPPSSWQPL